MKVAERIYNVQSTLEGERVDMSIDPDALAHIIAVLTDLYSDPEMAVVREYATNAYDAHIEAGVRDPIEVTLPTPLSPYLKIKDYGFGLDRDDIREVYSRYGASTKRDTNDLVGTLGLGCKSALTYTNQFTLQAVKDGRCIQVSISREANGSGSMKVVTEYETDAPSGVEITIPVKSNNDFAGKAEYLFQFWPEGSVLVSGKEPKRLSGIEIDTDLYIIDKTVFDQNVVVMGNVPYPMSDNNYQNYSIIAYVPIGAVQFTPSRESLQMTTSTTEVVEEIKERVKTRAKDTALRLMKEAPNRVEALKLSFKVGRLFGIKTGELLYKGEQVPTEFDSEGQENEFIHVRRFKYRYHKSQVTQRRFPIGLVSNTIFLTGYPNKTFSGYGRQKLEQWWQTVAADHADVEVENFLLVGDLPHAEWIDPKRVYDYAAVAAQKIVRPKRQDGYASGSYRVIQEGAPQCLQADEIDTSQPVYFFASHSNGGMKQICEVYPKASFVELTTNRIAKFQRLFPQAKPTHKGLVEIAQNWADGLKKEQIFALKLDRETRRALAFLDPTRVNDPRVVAAIAMSKKQDKSLFAMYDKYGSMCTLREIKWEDPSESYPLLMSGLNSCYYYGTNAEKQKALEHLYLYLNAVYHETETN